jgi:chlorophyll synthase
MAGAQLLVVGALWHWDEAGSAAAVAALLLVQLMLMQRFRANPIQRAVWYSGLGVTLYVVGMLVAAFALR